MGKIWASIPIKGMRFRSTGDCLDETVKCNSPSMSIYTLGKEDLARRTFQGLPPAVSLSSCDGVIEGKGILTASCEETWPQNVSFLSALYHGTPHLSQSDGKRSQTTHEIPSCTSCDTAWKDQRLLSDCSSLLLLKKFPGAENILNPFFSLIVKEERFNLFLHCFNPEIL